MKEGARRDTAGWVKSIKSFEDITPEKPLLTLGLPRKEGTNTAIPRLSFLPMTVVYQLVESLGRRVRSIPKGNMYFSNVTCMMSFGTKSSNMLRIFTNPACSTRGCFRRVNIGTDSEPWKVKNEFDHLPLTLGRSQLFISFGDKGNLGR